MRWKLIESVRTEERNLYIHAKRKRKNCSLPLINLKLESPSLETETLILLDSCWGRLPSSQKSLWAILTQRVFQGFQKFSPTDQSRTDQGTKVSADTTPPKYTHKTKYPPAWRTWCLGVSPEICTTGSRPKSLSSSSSSSILSLTHSPPWSAMN